MQDLATLSGIAAAILRDELTPSEQARPNSCGELRYLFS
jgi:hypothetical protein